MRLVAIIPARGGSKRIPEKNLALLGGAPLLAHTIRAAADAQLVDEVYVSTDSVAIAACARGLGARVIDRPSELANDTAPTEPALIHAVTTIEAEDGRTVDAVVMLQATSPLRGAARVDAAVRLLWETGADAVVSVTRDTGYYFLGDVDRTGRFTVGYDPNRRLRTQDVPPRYRENGAIYVMTRAQLMDRGCRMGGNMRALLLDDDESVDIDGPLDLALCEVLLARRAERNATFDGPSRQSSPALRAVAGQH